MTNETSHSTKPLVLHIDDSQTVVLVVRSLLEEMGLRVSNASSGLEGIEQAEKESPAIILLDAMMPGIDGVETCRRLKNNQHTKTIPVLMITGAGDAKDSARFSACGAAGCLTKPINGAQLKTALEAHIKLPTYEGQL